jgi:exodeoxyribonuclease VII large subunit
VNGSSITVSQLNLMVAEAIRKDPRTRSVTVRGEISGFKHHIASGHWYFSMKDEGAAVNCVMFRQNTIRSALRPRDGDSVVVTGYVDVYPKNGSYQLYVTGMRAEGIGDLYVRFEEMKRRLGTEGLFDPGRKRPLPMVPRKVAVVTSLSGAALHDILNVSGMRNPAIPIVVIPVGVQGEKAAAEIAAGIRAAGEKTDADVVIVARGGGSMEDLWCFNEEIVARAAAESRIPVVSGVGHETDTTIIDLAADARASTPSNAAEIVFPDRKELRGRMSALALTAGRVIMGEVRKREILSREARLRLGGLNPEKQISSLAARNRVSREALRHAMKSRMDQAESGIRTAGGKLEHAMTRRMDGAAAQAARARERLGAISPLGVLDRGYTLIQNREGKILTRRGQAADERQLTVRFADGTIRADVTEDGEE